MLYPQVPAHSWAQQHRIRTKGVPCPCCEYMLVFDRPLAMKGYRGLEASPCGGCGADTGVFRVVPVDRDRIELWESLRPEPQAL